MESESDQDIFINVYCLTFPQEWYYDDLDIPDVGEFEEPDADSDYDYEESYSKRKKKKPVVKPPRGVILLANSLRYNS